MSTVFISGISRGIGLGLSKWYLADGHRVIGSIRSETAKIDALSSQYAEALTIVKLDVARKDSVDAAAREVTRSHDALDLLICNAAVNPAQDGKVEALSDIDDQVVLDTFDVNVLGSLRLVRALESLLRKGQSAKVVVISSGAGSVEMTSNGGMVAYCVSKAALNMLSRRLHFLLSDGDISVLSLSPGWVKTDMGGPNAKISVDESAEGIARVIAAYNNDSPPFQDYTGKPLPW